MLIGLRLRIIKILLLTVQVFSSAPVHEGRSDSGFGSNDTVTIGRELINDSDQIPPSNIDKIIEFFRQLLIVVAISVVWFGFWYCCCFLPFAKCTKKIGIDDDDDHKHIHVVTTKKNDQNNYETVADLSGKSSIEFAVKAESDAQILLTADNGSLIEIVIGGYGGSLSVIRNKKQGPGLVHNGSRALNSNEFVYFKLR